MSETSGGKTAKEKVMISSYTILIAITLLVGLATIVLAQFVPGVTAASVSDILASPVLGFLDGIEVSLFLLILGGCLGIINKLGPSTRASLPSCAGSMDARRCSSP